LARGRSGSDSGSSARRLARAIGHARRHRLDHRQPIGEPAATQAAHVDTHVAAAFKATTCQASRSGDAAEIRRSGKTVKLPKLLASLKRFGELSDSADDLNKLSEKVSSLSEHIDWMHGTLESIRRDGLPSANVSPALQLALQYAQKPQSELYTAIYGGSRPLRGSPAKLGIGSTLCQQIHFALDEYRFWMSELGLEPRLHRKDWEYFYVAQTLWERDMLRPGKRGLVFAVGHEPMPAVFAKYGCDIVASDQAHEDAVKWGWAQSGQHSSGASELERPNICAVDEFYRRVSYRSVNMNDMPTDLTGFDFCWSICSFEHLGSIEHGMKFVENSLRTLVPGGVAVHTTEFNLSSNSDTIETENLSIFRRRDIEELASRLEAAGHRVEPLDLEIKNGFVENLVDVPPYRNSPHLRLRIEAYDCTSVGLIITRGR
jgi:hypothetical protein